MRHFSTLLLLTVFTIQAQAKVWRVNNNVAVNADFTSFYDAVQASTVVNGDTLYMESSATDYYTGNLTMTKKLTVIGMGYFTDEVDANYPPNTGLQAAKYSATLSGFNMGQGSAGSKFLGIRLNYVNIGSSTVPINLLFERCIFYQSITLGNANHDGITVRKCFFVSSGVVATQGSITNFVCENNIFFSTWAGLNMPALTGSTNIVRNNSWKDVYGGTTLVNCYVANNIINTAVANTFTNCTIKNNLFSSSSQTLPGTATGNQLGVNMADVYIGGTGSQDSRVVLKAGSPAIAAGVTVGAVTTPDCGAFGGTDPYKLSGIPNIPTIYTFTVPTSIPSGTATMNVTFSTRNNN